MIVRHEISLRETASESSKFGGQGFTRDAIVRLSIKNLKSCATANAIVTFLVVANELIKNIIVCNEFSPVLIKCLHAFTVY